MRTLFEDLGMSANDSKWTSVIRLRYDSFS
jgi:hypothetical protein